MRSKWKLIHGTRVWPCSVLLVMLIVRLTLPSLAGAGAEAELGNNSSHCYHCWVFLYKGWNPSLAWLTEYISSTRWATNTRKAESTFLKKHYMRTLPAFLHQPQLISHPYTIKIGATGMSFQLRVFFGWLLKCERCDNFWSALAQLQLKLNSTRFELG